MKTNLFSRLRSAFGVIGEIEPVRKNDSVPPTPPVVTQADDGNYRAKWMRVFNAVDYQVHRMNNGYRACNDLITVKEIAKSAKVTSDFARQVMRDLGNESRAIEECLVRL